MLKVTVVAFRHKTPGEGVGGIEWDLDPLAARRRVREAGVYDDPAYETWEKDYEIGDQITEMLDAAAWEDWT
jgi:hypothetical protein